MSLKSISTVVKDPSVSSHQSTLAVISHWTPWSTSH